MTGLTSAPARCRAERRALGTTAAIVVTDPSGLPATVHHIVDPRTGDVAASCRRTATVVAASCVAANIASTAAVVMGRAAVPWLARCALPARLVAEDGAVTEVAGWPAERQA